MEITNNPADGMADSSAVPPTDMDTAQARDPVNIEAAMQVASSLAPENPSFPEYPLPAAPEASAEQPVVPEEQSQPVNLVSDLPPIPPQEVEPTPTPQPAVQPEMASQSTDIDQTSDVNFLPDSFPENPSPEQQPQPSLDADEGMPDTSEMQLDDIDEEAVAPEPVRTIKVRKTAAIVLAILAIGLLYSANSGILGSQKTSVKDYKYSFRFYRHSKVFAYGNGTALKHEIDNTIASVRPSQAADLKDCTTVGNGWKPVMHATMNKTNVSVCTPDNKSFIAIFPAAGHEQIFTVIYNSVQKPDIYPELKNILESVSVKK